LLSDELSRRNRALSATDAYIDTFDVQHLEFAQLGQAMDAYDAVSEKLSVRITDLRKRLDGIEREIDEQAGNAQVEREEGKLGLQASIGVFAPEAGQIDLVLIYGVSIFLCCFILTNKFVCVKLYVRRTGMPCTKFAPT
jgi:hypothetical protein